MGTYIVALLDKPLQDRYSYWGKYKHTEELHSCAILVNKDVFENSSSFPFKAFHLQKNNASDRQQSPYNSCSLLYQGICFLGNKKRDEKYPVC